MNDKRYLKAMLEHLRTNHSIKSICQKQNLKPSRLKKYVETYTQKSKREFGEDITEIVRDTKQALMIGVNNLTELKESDEKVFNMLADDILAEIQYNNLEIARNIQIIGKNLLNDLNNEIENLRNNRALDLKMIKSSFTNLALANEIMGLPKQPNTLIQIQNQNNQQNNNTQEIQEITLKVELPNSEDDKE